MANTIILKRSSTPGKVPTTSQLELGEVAINTYDGRLFIKKNNGTPSVVEIGGVTTVNSLGGTVVLDTDDISEGSSNQYFTTARARSAVSAGTGISYSSSTGVIATSQAIATSSSPTFAGLTLTGSATTRSIIPAADNTYSLGSPTMAWKDVYVGPGSLYVNGKEVIHDTSGTMNFTTDTDQNLRITTTGSGILQLGSSTTDVNIDGTLQLASGKRITDSSGVNVQFGDVVNMNSNKIINLGAPSSNADAATKKYVDDTISAISTSSITQGNSNVTVVDTGTGQVQVNVDGTTALTVTSTGVVVAGNFTVSGTSTTVNSNTVAIADNILTLNSDTTGAPTQNAGIEVERGDSANVQLRWNEGSSKWTFTNDGSVYNPMAVNTDDLAEGSTNLYFTNSRARSALSVSSSTGISYNSSTGNFSLGSIPNTALTNNSITINGSATALGGTRTLGSDDITEGSTNLYFTNSRARSAVSATAGTGLSYNSSTGAFSLSSIPNSSLTNSAVTIGSTGISLGSTASSLAGLTSVTSTGFTGALTGNADTATALKNARTINGVSFDGTSNITVATAGTGISVSGTAVSIDTATTVDKTTAQTLTNKSLVDNTTYFVDDGDATRKFQFQLGSIATGTTRIFTMPDVNGTLVTTGDTGSVTNAMLAGSIANSKLANSSTTIGTTAISLGSSSTTLGGLTSVTSTSFVGALTGNASTATALATARTINGISFDGTSNITVLTGGTGINVSGTTVSIDSSTVITASGLATLTNKTLTDASTYFADDSDSTKKMQFQLTGVTSGATRVLTVPNNDGTLVTTGDTGTVTNTMLAGSIANAKLSNSSVTVGSTSISLGSTATTLAGLTSVTSTGFTGALTGNASTATALQTARTIQGVSFDGSANITVVTAGTGIGVSGTTVTNNGVLTITGTSNQVIASASTGAVTLSLPQSIATTSSPTFASVTNTTSGIFNGSTSGAITVQAVATAGTNTITLPATTGTVVTTGDTGTVTNAMLAGSIATSKITGLATSATTDTTNAANITSGTLPNARLLSVPNSALANSSVTVGTTAISLGSSSTTLGGLTSVTSTSFVGALTGNASTVTNGVYTTDTGTVTNAMLAGSIANSKLTNSSVTVTAGTGMSGGGAVSLGGSITLTNTGILSIAGTAPISVSTTSGAATVSISAATTIAAGSMSAADKSKLDGIASGATANTGTVTSVATGNGLTGGTITTSGTLSMSGSYTGTFAVTGGITATGEITAYFSDERLKMDINPIEGALAKVMAIGGYTYKANDLAHSLGVERYDNQIGLLAGEVEAVMPELVTESGLKGYKTIRYDKVVSVLVEAIKEQQEMINQLRKDVKTLH